MKSISFWLQLGRYAKDICCFFLPLQFRTMRTTYANTSRKRKDNRLVYYNIPAIRTLRTCDVFFRKRIVRMYFSFTLDVFKKTV